MKYIDVEKLKTEIEKRINYQRDCIKNDYRLSGKAEEEIIFEYGILLRIINSLPLEQPKCGCSEKPNDHAEWSEEDNHKLNRIYEILGYAADDKGFLTSKRIIGDKEAIELQDFLRSIAKPEKSAEWMSEQGEFYEGKIQVSMRTGDLVAVATVPDEKYNFNDKVIVQIRKAE